VAPGATEARHVRAGIAGRNPDQKARFAGIKFRSISAITHCCHRQHAPRIGVRKCGLDARILAAVAVLSGRAPDEAHINNVGSVISRPGNSLSDLGPLAGTKRVKNLYRHHLALPADARYANGVVRVAGRDAGDMSAVGVVVAVLGSRDGCSRDDAKPW
jgi:hypothetical protein